jgi:hypothetical protein
MRLVPTTIAMAVVLTLGACGGGGGGTVQTTEVPTAPVLQAMVNARYQIVLTDAVTGERITDPLKLTFVSGATLRAADGSTLAGKTVTTTAGLFAVDADFTAAANDFSVQVADGGTAGWVASGSRVVGQAGLTGDTIVSIKLLNTKKAAQINTSTAPIALAVTAGQATATGALQADVSSQTVPRTVTTADGSTIELGVAKLDVSAGTVGTTATGAPAAPGPLTVVSTYYAATEGESQAALPGGFSAGVEVPAAQAAVLNGVAPENATMQVAGFAQFNITDSAGNPIKHFDKPVTLGIDLLKTTLNDADVPVQAGDQFPVWSYDEAAGKWVFEKMGTIAEKTPVDPTYFTVEFQTTHLSSWTLANIKGSCTAQVNLVPQGADDNRQLDVTILGRNYGIFAKVTDRAMTLYKAPTVQADSITVYDRGVVVGKVTNKSMCTTTNVPITLAPRVRGTVRAEFTESCADGSQSRAAPTYVTYGQNNTYVNGYGVVPTGTTGVAVHTTTLEAGAAELVVQNPRTLKYETREITVPANGTVTARFNFPMSCAVVTGGSSN